MRPLLALLLVASGFGGCSSLPPASQVTTAQATHSYIMAGTGTPTVVFEAGLGDGKESWAPVFGHVAGFTRVVAYDRAGYGASASAARPRDATRIVRELRSMLDALGLQPPFVLVGHSIGGTYVELFARTYPAEVAGVVLVDARHADFTRRCLAATAGSCEAPALLSALLPLGPRRELAAAGDTMNEVLHGGPFPAVPLAVLTSVPTFPARMRYRSLWIETQRSLAALSADSTHTICDMCGHYVHRDNPSLVVAAISDVLRRNH